MREYSFIHEHGGDTPLRWKSHMYERYQAGEFGNKLRTWASLDEWLKSGYDGNVVLRSKGLKAGKFAHYNIPPEYVYDIIATLQLQGVTRSDIMFSEQAPDQDLVIQGEVMRSPRFLELRYSTEKNVVMRKAMECPSHTWGINAIRKLRAAMTPDSWDDLELIFDRYPNHVVEFSTYAHDVGNIPHRNTIVWEVRQSY